MSELFHSEIISSERHSSNKRQSENYHPIPWSDYFNFKEDFETDVGTFRIYRRGVEGLLLFFIHGVGFSALSWSLLSKSITQEVKCQCLAMDIRGHGDTLTTNDVDLSIDTLAKDVRRIVMAMYPTEAPPIILIGHSMGGAIAIHSAVKSMVPSLVGLVVIDVVEEAACDELITLNKFIQTRPNVFKSLQDAIQWSFQTNDTKNLESAKVSIPGQLKCISTDLSATKDVDSIIDLLKNLTDKENDEQLRDLLQENQNHRQSPINRLKENYIEEEFLYTWRTDLTVTEPFWKEWFKDMSEMFLSISQPKLLFLAGIDTLDKELMVVKMQDKFHLQIIPEAGYAVHEDFPEKIADYLANFLIRNRFTEPKVPL